MKYNFIIYNLGEDYYRYLTIPWSKEPNVYVHKKGFDGNKLTDTLFFYHWSHKINQVVDLPLKNIWFSSMYRNPFSDGKPICFVFAGGKYITQSVALRRFILNKNPENKCVIYCGDLIAKKHWDIDRIRKCCDAIVTYDPEEAQKYGVFCYDKPVYGRIAPLTTPNTFEYDVFFLGYAKDRLNTIRNTYEKLTAAGLKCKFIVCGVKKEDQFDDGLEYGNPIPYDENLAYVNRSKCILELIQGGSSAGTLRRSEALVYKRKLLTNNLKMQGEAYFNPKNMAVFSSPEDIDIDFIKQPVDYSSFPDEKEYAPQQLLGYFEKILEEKGK